MLTVLVAPPKKRPRARPSVWLLAVTLATWDKGVTLAKPYELNEHLQTVRAVIDVPAEGEKTHSDSSTALISL